MATLVGLHNEKRYEGEKTFLLQSKILSIDGRAAKLSPGKALKLTPGCHLVEASVLYRATNAMDDPCPWYPLVGGFGACDRSTYYRSGRRYFAIPMEPRKRYELSVLINADAVWVSFVEVDAELGTVARFIPVHRETRTCSPGIPVGSTPGSSRQAMASHTGRAW